MEDILQIIALIIVGISLIFLLIIKNIKPKLTDKEKENNFNLEKLTYKII